MLPDEEGWDVLATRMSKLAGSQNQNRTFQYEHLGNIVEDLSSHVEDKRSQSLKLIFFAETEVMDVLNSCVVGRSDSVLLLEDEDTFGEVCVAGDMKGNHVSMCKYRKRDCDGYLTVLEKLAQVLGDTNSPGLGQGLEIDLGPWRKQPRWKKQVRGPHG